MDPTHPSLSDDSAWSGSPAGGSPEAARMAKAWEDHCESAAQAVEREAADSGISIKSWQFNVEPGAILDDGASRAKHWRALGKAELIQALVVHELSPEERSMAASSGSPVFIENILAAGRGRQHAGQRSTARLNVLGNKLGHPFVRGSRESQLLFPDKAPFNAQGARWHLLAKGMRSGRLALISALLASVAALTLSRLARDAWGVQGQLMLAFFIIELLASAVLLWGCALMVLKRAPDDCAAQALLKACYPRAPDFFLSQALNGTLVKEAFTLDPEPCGSWGREPILHALGRLHSTRSAVSFLTATTRSFHGTFDHRFASLNPSDLSELDGASDVEGLLKVAKEVLEIERGLPPGARRSKARSL